MAELNLLSAREAAERLGIKLDTLYAYVSRGLLQSVSFRAAASAVIGPRMSSPAGRARRREAGARTEPRR